MATERRELHCHACGMYVQFNIDTSLNGNHVLNCPNCGHEHCRVVKDGEITDERWDQRNADQSGWNTYIISKSTTSYTSTSIDIQTYANTNFSFSATAWTNLAASTWSV